MVKQPFGLGQRGQLVDQRNIVKKQVMGADLNSIMEQINTVSRRLRVLEERYSNLDKRIQVSDQNMLSSHKSINTELKATVAEVNELKKEISSMKDTVKLVIQELKRCSKREDVKVLEKYINLWEPVKFVTRNQVEDLIREILKKQE